MVQLLTQYRNRYISYVPIARPGEGAGFHVRSPRTPADGSKCL